jgi:hypothetical protein
MRLIWSALLTAQLKCAEAACSTIAANSADFPLPGSPFSKSTPPHPKRRTRRSILSAVAISSERPRNTILATSAALLVYIIAGTMDAVPLSFVDGTAINPAPLPRCGPIG